MALYSSSDVNLCVGDFEYEYLKKAFPNIPLYNMPIFIYDRFMEDFEPFENRKDLLFVGGFNHPPNKDGVLWFVKDILPSLVERIPDIRFHIVGSNAPAEIRKLVGAHVVVDGFVSDEELAGLYRSCRVVVAPLRYGAGVKGKIIEALYNRSAVVTTSIGAEGIPSDNHPFAIADTPEDFSKAVLTVYTDRSVWDAYLRNSLEMIKSVYSYEKAVNLLTEIFSKQH
jgi:glycosyltransferase involved in cell wall biosynthesis